MQKFVNIEFAQEEIDALSRLLTELDENSYFDVFSEEDDGDEEFDEILGSAINKIFENATPVEQETVILPKCFFPSGCADYLISSGLASETILECDKEDLALI